MQSIWKSTLEEIRITTASEKPLATSGALSIITAVYGCSLAIMALKLSAKRKSAGLMQQRRFELIDGIQEVARLLGDLADKDIAAFHAFLDVKALEGKVALKNAAGLEAIRIPLLAASEIQKIFPLIEAAVPLCKKNLLCDLAAGANNCACAVTNLVLTVNENTRTLEAKKKATVLRSARKLMDDANRYALGIGSEADKSAVDDSGRKGFTR